MYLTNRIKSMNQSIYYNTGDIHKAITEGEKQISFQYLTYTITKEETFRRGGKRAEVSPFALIYAEEKTIICSPLTAKLKYSSITE